MLPYFDYRPALARMREEIDAAVARVLDSGRLILGDEVAAFETEFAAYAGAPHAVGVASGTDAVLLALRGLDVGAGDEVVTVANAGVPPVAAIRALGAIPRFVDVREDTLLLDAARLDEAITPRTRAVVAVHLYGQMVDVDAVGEVCRRHDVPLVEDCAQAHGARRNGHAAGSVGTYGCFSFYPTKNLGAFGDGGCVVTADPARAERLRLERMYGFRDGPTAVREGINSRLDELQAALLRVRLAHLPEETVERSALAARYRAALPDRGFRPVVVAERSEPVWHLFVVRCDDRAEAIRRLDAAGIGYGIHYPAAVHRMPGYAFLGGRAGDLPVTEDACSCVLSLPLYAGLEPGAVDRVVAALRDA